MPTNSLTEQNSNASVLTPSGTGVREACQFASQARWYALRVMSRREFLVRDALRELQCGEFLPTWTERVRWSDRTKITVRPLFTGYLFARFDRSSRAAAVLGISGVISILGTNGELSAIADDEISNLRRIVESPAPVSLCPYVAGERVTVGRGPLAGASGVVTRTKGSTRLVVSIEILQRAVSVEIDAGDIEKGK